MATNASLLNQQAATLIQQRRYDEANALLRQSLQLEPNNADTHAFVGNICVYEAKYDEAIAAYQQALRFNPNHFGARYILGIALHDKGRYGEAEIQFRQALRINPNFAEAHDRLGLTLQALKRLDQAVACYRQALRLQPAFAQAANNLATALNEQNKLDEAITWYQHALQLDPQCAQIHFNLGKTMEQLNMLDKAVESYQQALRLNPQMAGAYLNLGRVYSAQDILEKAIAHYQQAIRLQPDYAHAYTNLGNVFRDLGRHKEALECYEQGLRPDPDFVGPHHNRALLWLLQGEWEKGWPEYEWRWRTPEFPRYTFKQPRWDGSPLNGRNVLVFSEQGLGDSIQFVRYLPLVQQRGGRVIFQGQPALMRLLANFPGIDRYAGQTILDSDFDLQTPLLSLPGIFQTTLDNVPSRVPYLEAQPELVEKWRNELAPLNGLKVGLAWQGNPTYGADHRRSIPLTRFAPLTRAAGVHFISLQKGPGTEQIGPCAGQVPLMDLGNRLDEAAGPFMDTAAIMKNLDLVICSDTAAAHLAGALGVPVWVATSFAPDWRWLLHREDSPWYPTMRLFRQTRYGHWEDVIDRMSRELQSLVASTK